MGVGCFLIWVCGIPFLVSLNQRKAAMISGLAEAAEAVGGILGPPIGSLLFAQNGFVLPFLITGALLMICPLIGFAVFRTTPGTEKDEETKKNGNDAIDNNFDPTKPLLETSDPKSFTTFITNPNIVISALPYFVGSTIFGYFNVSLAPYLQETFEIEGNTVGYYVLINSITNAVSCAVTGKLTEAGYGAFLYALVPLFSTVAFLSIFLPFMFPVLQNLNFFLTFWGLFGILYAVSSVCSFLVCEKVTVSQNFVNLAVTKAFVATLWGLTFSIGRLFGSFVIGGVVLSALGFYMTNLVLAIFCLMTTVLTFASLVKLRLLKKLFYADQMDPDK